MHKTHVYTQIYKKTNMTDFFFEQLNALEFHLVEHTSTFDRSCDAWSSHIPIHHNNIISNEGWTTRWVTPGSDTSYQMKAEPLDG